MKNIILFCLVLCCYFESRSQGREEEGLSIDMISSEIKRSMDENERQKELNRKQNINTSVEVANKEQWKKYKETVKKIQDRLRIVDFALQAIPSGYVVYQKSQEIKNTQNRIYREIRTAPQSLKEVIPKQLKFVDDLQMVVRFLTGIAVSYGAINQMERAERQILLDYALAEVEKLASDSSSILTIIQLAKQRAMVNKGILDFYINRDKEIIQDILKNVKKL